MSDAEQAPETPLIDCPILAEKSPEKLVKLGSLEDHKGVLYWAVKVDGVVIRDDFDAEGRPLRLPHDITAIDLVDQVCPEDGIEHRIEATLKGGKQHAPRATVKLGVHRRNPSVASSPASAPAPPSWTPPVPPADAWTQVIELAQQAHAHGIQLAAAEREAHMKLVAAQQLATAQMFQQGMQSVERGLQAVAATQAHAAAQAQAGAGEAQPDLLSMILEKGPAALELGQGLLDLVGLEAGDLKGIVMGKVTDAAEGSIKKALAENLGAGALMLMEAGSEAIKAKMGVSPTAAAADAAAGAVDGAAAAAETAA